MEGSNRIDLSLDDIIKLNRKNKAVGKKQNQQGQRQPGVRRGGQTRGGRGAAKIINNQRPTYKTGTKIRRFGQQRLQGFRGRGGHSRVNQAVAGSRQVLRNAIRNRQRQQRQLSLNKVRGVNTYNSQQDENLGQNGRRRLARPGFGILQSDILAQQIDQRKKQLAFKQAIDQAKFSPKRPVRRPWRRNRQQYRGESGVGMPLPGPVRVTVSLDNDINQSERVAQVQSRRAAAAAHRLIRQSIRQPAVVDNVVSATNSVRGVRGRGRARGSSRGPTAGQVRILTNSIKNLQRQVAELKASTPTQGTVAVRGRRGNRRSHGNRNLYNNNRNRNRTVVW